MRSINSQLKLSVWGAELSEAKLEQMLGRLWARGARCERGVPDVSARWQRWPQGGCWNPWVTSCAWCRLWHSRVTTGWLLWPSGASCEPWEMVVAWGRQLWAPTPGSGNPTQGQRAALAGPCGLCPWELSGCVWPSGVHNSNLLQEAAFCLGACANLPYPQQLLQK